MPSDAPAKTWEHAAQLTDRDWQIYEHYSECKAVWSFPDDVLVLRHAAIIRKAEDTAANREVVKGLDNMTAVLTGLLRVGMAAGAVTTAGGRGAG